MKSKYEIKYNSSEMIFINFDLYSFRLAPQPGKHKFWLLWYLPKTSFKSNKPQVCPQSRKCVTSDAWLQKQINLACAFMSFWKHHNVHNQTSAMKTQTTHPSRLPTHLGTCPHYVRVFGCHGDTSTYRFYCVLLFCTLALVLFCVVPTGPCLVARGSAAPDNNTHRVTAREGNEPSQSLKFHNYREGP